MKKLKMRAIAALLGLTLVVGSAGTSSVAFASKGDNGTDSKSRVPEYNTSDSYGEYFEKYASEASAEEEIVLKGSEYSETDMDVTVDGDTVVTSAEGSISWIVDAPSDAMYEIEIEYGTLENGGNEIQMSLLVNGEIPFAEATTVVFRRMYMDENKDYQTQTGNQTFPPQVEFIGWQTMSVSDNEGYYTGALQFFFEKGENTLTLKAVKDNLMIKSITLKPVTKLPTYAEYYDSYKDSVVSTSTVDRVQAENADLKSEKSYRPMNDRTSPGSEPYHPSNIVLNTIGGSSWSQNGNWMEWTFDVAEAGLYKITTRFKQSEKAGFSSIRTVSVNGEIPFAEANDIRFEYDSKFQVSNLTSSETGEDLYFYFEKGKNVVRLTCSLGGYADIANEINAVIEELQAVYQSITAITGTAPNSYQDYQLTERLPNLTNDFLAVADHLETVKNSIVELTGSESDVSSSMTRCVDLLREISAKPSKIQTKVTAIADNITALGSSIMSLTQQPLTLDWLQLSGADDKLPAAEKGFFARLKHEILSFIGSFTNDYSVADTEGETGETDRDPITVWISTGRDQMDVVRRLINESFTPVNGIPVEVKLVDANIIMTAIAAGTGPDVAIGVSSNLPMELGFRGAAYDLTVFEDFEETKELFMDAATECYEFEDQYWALPDQMSFSVMFYRKDILSQYNVEVPETWEDLITIIPTLATYNMEAYLDKNTMMTLGSAVSVGANKAVNGVYLSMLYQKGGELYNEEGTEALLDTKESIASFTTWTEFYSKYGFSTTIDFVTRFRLGSVPIAIMDISYYNRLSISAPEINGKWGIALVPGTVQADGTINHSTPVTTSASMIIESTVEKNGTADESWEFLKWWTSANTQSSYSSEMEAVLGSSGRYMVANLESFGKVSWSTDVAAVLNDSLQWLREVKQLPGSYLTGLNLDNAFYQVINNSTDEPIDVITEYNESLNEEIEKKRSEFGLDK